MRKKKGNLINLLICGAAFAVMVVVLLMDGIDNIVGAIARINPLFLLLAALCMVLYWLGEGVGLHLAARKLDGNTKFSTSMLVTMIGQYFNCITPGASGGQPMQAYTFFKRGMPLGTAMTALLSRFIVYQFTLTVYSVVFLVIELPTLAGGEHSGMIPLILIGFAVNTAVIILLFMLAFFKKATLGLAHGVIRLLGKLHIVKNTDEKIKYVDAELDKYYDNFMYIRSQPLMIIKMLLVTALQLLVYFSITYVIYLGFGLSGADYFEVISSQAFVLMISSFVPLPGAMGAAEGSYAAFFGSIFGKQLTVVSTFIWRFLTFYFPIIVGIIINLVMSKNGVDLNSTEDDAAYADRVKAPENIISDDEAVISAVDTKELYIPATLDNLNEAIGFIDRVLGDGGCGIKVRTRTELVVEELFVNIAQYAYGAEGGKVHIKAGISEEPHTLTISFADSGKEFDPLADDDPDTPALSSEHGIGGLGLFLVKKNMYDIKYERSDGMNILTVRKVLAEKQDKRE